MKYIRRQTFLIVTLLALGVVGVDQYNPAFLNIVVGSVGQMANVVSMSASVPQNEVNTLVAQFDAKQKELTDRENQVAERESEVKVATDDFQRKIVIFISAITILLLLLILLNFYLDSRRRRVE